MSTSCSPGSRAGLAPVSTNATDAHLESALNRMTLRELGCLQDILIGQLGRGLPSIEQIAKALERQDVEVAAWFRFREAQQDAVKVVMLLGALGVAIAWMTHRGAPAPPQRLRNAIARIGEDHVYMLPIPRSDPCFCGSGSRFRACHGKVPLAAPAV
jgi:SEC-C motif-containing protein